MQNVLQKTVVDGSMESRISLGLPDGQVIQWTVTALAPIFLPSQKKSLEKNIERCVNKQGGLPLIVFDDLDETATAEKILSFGRCRNDE